MYGSRQEKNKGAHGKRPREEQTRPIDPTRLFGFDADAADDTDAKRQSFYAHDLDADAEYDFEESENHQHQHQHQHQHLEKDLDENEDETAADAAIELTQQEHDEAQSLISRLMGSVGDLSSTNTHRSKDAAAASRYFVGESKTVGEQDRGNPLGRSNLDLRPQNIAEKHRKDETLGLNRAADRQDEQEHQDEADEEVYDDEEDELELFLRMKQEERKEKKQQSQRF